MTYKSVCCAAWAVVALYGQTEFAYPFTAKIQARPTAAGQTAETFFLPKSARLSCLDTNAAGTKILCLSEMGSVLTWSADNQIRRLAEGFKGPLQGRIANDGSVWVLDIGAGRLVRLAVDGTSTVVLGSGTNRDPRLIPEGSNPRDFDFTYFLEGRQNTTGSAQLAMDPAGNVFVHLAYETRIGTLATQAQSVLRLQNNGKELYKHWTPAPAKFGDQPNLKDPPPIPPTPVVTAMAVDADHTIIFAINGRLARLSSQGELRDLSGGNLSIFNNNPVAALVAGPGGETIIQAADGRLFSAVIGALDGRATAFARLDGLVARDGEALVGLDQFADRLVRYERTGSQEYKRTEAAALLHTLPIGNGGGFRPSFEAPSSVTVDTLNLINVVDAGDGNLYEIAPDGKIRTAAATNFAADKPPGRFVSELFKLNELPYPIAGASKGNGTLLYLVDTSCNVFTQLDQTTVRFLGQLSQVGGCTGAKVLFDTTPAGRLHIVVPQGIIFVGTGDPKGGEWRFEQVFAAGGPIRSVSSLTTGDFLVLEGDGKDFGRMRMFNPTTRAVREVAPPRDGPTVTPMSAVAMGGGGVLAVSGAAGRALFYLDVTDTGVLQVGSLFGVNRIALFSAENEQAEEVFPHRLGAVIRSTAGRLYFYPSPRVSDQDRMVFPTTRQVSFAPGIEVEVPMDIRAAAGTAMGFRTALTCDAPYDKFVRLGPLTGQTPAVLSLRIQTDWVVLNNGRCVVRVVSPVSGRTIAQSVVELAPDAAATKQIPEFSLLDVLTPMRIDPAAGPVTVPLRIMNKTPNTRYFSLRGALPEGVTVSTADLTVEQWSFRQVEITIDPKKLDRQNYQLPLQISCDGCARKEDLLLSFQLVRGSSPLELSSESVRIEGATLTLVKSVRASATNLMLQGVDAGQVATAIDFRKAAPWFRVERTGTREVEPGKVLAQYEIVMTGATLPVTELSAVVSFGVTGRADLPRRYLTVFYLPSDTARKARVEGVASGGIVNVGTGAQETITVPVLNRTDQVLGYTVSTSEAGGEAGSSVSISQGVISKGAGEVQLTVAGGAGEGVQSESKTVMINFSNGESISYQLGVVKSPGVAGKASVGRRELTKCAKPGLVVVPTEPSMPFLVVQNIGQRFLFEVRDECNQAINYADGGRLVFAVQPVNGSVTTTSVGNGRWEVFWKPERAVEGAKIKVTALRSVSAFEIYGGELLVSGRVLASGVPGLRSFSLVDAASFVEKRFTAPGSHITVFGDNLAAVATASSGEGSLPRELANVEVLFDGKAAPLEFVSQTQINLQVPYDVVSNEYRMTVRVGDVVSAPAAVVVGNVSPGIFTVNNTGGGQGQIYHRDVDGNIVLADAANPAAEGEELWILASGLGVTDPIAADGVRTPDLGEGNYHLAAGPITARIGGVVTPAWAALMPSLIGVYRVTVTVPVGVVGGGSVPVSLISGGQESQVVGFGKR